MGQRVNAGLRTLTREPDQQQPRVEDVIRDPQQHQGALTTPATPKLSFQTAPI